MLLPAIAVVQQARYVSRAVLPAQTPSTSSRSRSDSNEKESRRRSGPNRYPAVSGVRRRDACRRQSPWDHRVARLGKSAAMGGRRGVDSRGVSVFLTTERLAGRTAAVVASLLFIFLPSLARLGADGIGDALHLCLVRGACWFFLDERRFVSPELCIAAALLVRAEATVVPIADRSPSPCRDHDVPSPELLLGRGVLPRAVSRGRRYVADGNCRTAARRCGSDRSVAAYSPAAFLERILDSDANTPTIGHKDRTRSSRFHGPPRRR